MVERAFEWPGSGRRGQPVFVVLKQKTPCVDVACDEFENGLSGIVHQRPVPQCPGEQVESLPGFVQAALGKTAFVRGEAAFQMVPQRAGSPLTEAHAPPGIDPVADGNDDVQVVVLQSAPYPAPAFGLNYREILGSCPFLQLAVGIDVPEMAAHVVNGHIEDPGYLSLGQPDCLLVKAHVHARLTVRRLVNDHLASGARRECLLAHLTILRALGGKTDPNRPDGRVRRS